MPQDVPDVIRGMGGLARDHLSEAHTYRMAMVHLIFGCRAHVNHMHGALGELGSKASQMSMALEGLRDDARSLLETLERLTPAPAQDDGMSDEIVVTSEPDLPKAGSF